MFFLYALKYLIEKKDIIFFILIILGSSFHTSLLIVIFGYIFVKRFKFKTSQILIFISIISILFYIFMFYGIVDILNVLSSFGLHFMTDRMVSNYLVDNRSLPITTFIKIALTLVLIFYNYNKLKTNESYVIFLKFYLLFVILIITFNKFDIMMRLWVYFEITSIFLIPMVIRELKYIYLKISLYFFYCIIYVSSLFVMLNGFDDGIFKEFNLIFF
jgi:hypothetical protein